MTQKEITLQRFRAVAIAEGVSFLVLLLIAMPFKYGLGIEWPVKVTGWAHGVLFVAYTIYLLRCHLVCKWPVRITGLAFIAAFLPFGPFVLDRRLIKKPAPEPKPTEA